MAEDDDQESKTEQPTDKRLAQAREKGNVAQSQEVKTWAVLLAGTVIVVLMAPTMAGKLAFKLRTLIELPHTLPTDFDGLRRLLVELAVEVGLVLAMPFALMIVVAIATGYLQHGMIFSWEKLKPNLNKLNPLKGLQRYLSPQPWLELLKGVLKIVIVAIAIGMVIWPRRKELDLLVMMEVPTQLDYLTDVVAIVLYTVLVITGVIAAADYAYQRFDYMKRMRMTKQEVQDEYKQSEGDPHVKSRIRRLRVERSRQRMMQAVPTADVVITNPTHYAVVLKYDMENMNAPKVVAKGVDHLAMRIREIAIEHEVNIVENPPLARALYAAVEIDQEIPADHYKAVAEIIGYVMRLKGKLKQ